MKESRLRHRVEWIDVAKGIGIILVCFGHIRNGSGESVWLPALDGSIDAVYLFHMPLFFFLGGLTFKGSVPFGKFIARKAKTLLVPYYVFSLYFLAKPISALIAPQLNAAMRVSRDYGDIGWQFVKVLFFGSGLWFLWAYFVGELLVYCINRAITLSGAGNIIMGLVFIFIGMRMEDIGLVSKIPFQLVLGVKAAGFILLGIACKGWLSVCWHGIRDNNPSQKRIVGIAGIGTLVLFVITAVWFLKTSDTNGWLNFWIKFAGAFLGTAFTVFLSLICWRTKWLSYIGRHSISFYCVNAFTLNIGKILFFKVLNLNVSESAVAVQWVIGLLLTAFCLGLLWAEDWLIRRFIPWSIGLKTSKTVDMKPAEI